MSNISRSNKILAAMACSLMLAQFSYAQDDADAGEFVWDYRNENIKSLEFSYGVPDSPALSLSGLSNSDVTTVNQLRDFVVTLPKFDDSETAIGVDVKPLSLFGGRASTPNTIKAYAEQRRYRRVLDRTGISLLAKNGVEDDDPSKSTKSLISLGFSSSLLDSSDPLLIDVENNKVCEFYFETVKSLEDQELTPTVLSKPSKEIRALRGELRTAKNNFPEDASKLGDYAKDLEKKVKRFDDLEMVFTTYANTNNIPDSERMSFKSDAKDTLSSLISKITNPVEGDPLPSKDQFVSALNGFISDINTIRVALLNNPRYIRTAALATAEQVKAATDCQAEINKKLKRAANWDIGAAHIWRGATDEFSDFDAGAYALWTSVRVPLFNSKGEKDSYWVFGATARLGFDETVLTGDDAVTSGDADTTSVWGGLEYFSEKWRAGARYGWVETDYSDAALDAFSSDGERWLLNADYNVAPNVWLTATYGEADGTVEALQGEQLSVGLKFSTPTALNFFE